MSRLLASALLAGTLLAARAHPSQADENITISVRIYNYANLDPGSLSEAQRRAATLFKHAGLIVSWMPCPVSDGCSQPLGTGDIVLNLLSDKAGRRLLQSSETLGLAVPGGSSRLGTAYVFVKKVDDLALTGRFSVRSDIARAVVRAHVIAHEIGHLLLGPGAHSNDGIMSWPWSSAVVKRIADMNLFFRPEEARLMRERLRGSALRGAVHKPE